MPSTIRTDSCATRSSSAIEKLRRDHPNWPSTRGPIEALVLKESSRYYSYLTLRYNLVQRDAGAPADRCSCARSTTSSTATLDRIYRLLGLIYPWKDIAAARYTIEHGDGRTRAGAIEYMDNLLGGAVRKRVHAHHRRLPDGREGAARQLLPQDRAARPRETRSRSSCTTSDQVVAAAAIHFVEQRQTVVAHATTSSTRWRTARSPTGTSSKPLHGRSPHTGCRTKRRDLWMEPLPAVELADRAAHDRRSSISSRSTSCSASPARAARCATREGASSTTKAPRPTKCSSCSRARCACRRTMTRRTSSPRRPRSRSRRCSRAARSADTIRAVDRDICLALSGDEFLTMLSDNIVLAQGLFRMLLDTPKARQWRTVYTPKPDTEPST